MTKSKLLIFSTVQLCPHMSCHNYMSKLGRVGRGEGRGERAEGRGQRAEGRGKRKEGEERYQYVARCRGVAPESSLARMLAPRFT